MNIKDWLSKQSQLYLNQTLPDDTPTKSIHPVSGEWQNSSSMNSKFWWGGGASQEACEQIELGENAATLTQAAVITFGPVQTFLGGGQRLRDWAVASWLCHYLSAVLIYRWEEAGGKVLLPLHQSSELINWLWGTTSGTEQFWQAELPNVVTGLYPDEPDWLQKQQAVIKDEWQRFLAALEDSAIDQDPRLLNGQGWRVIHLDHQYLWSVYAESTSLNMATVSEDIDKLHKRIESRKIGRQWQGTWWGGRTSPSDGCLSIWHPGLRLIYQGGTWGLPDDQIKSWWERATQESKFQGLFSQSDRLNSIELVKRLASVPEIIKPTLERLWKRTPPNCPWGKFPDRTAAAAAWVTDAVEAKAWNQEIQSLNAYFFPRRSNQDWGMPKVDNQSNKFSHPRVLERRNIEDETKLPDWEEYIPKGWESTIEWTVGWRGDGDRMGEWLSGKQYNTLKLPWSNWHPSPDLIAQNNLSIQPKIEPTDAPRQIELPHMLDLSILFSLWNQLLYPLTEEHHQGKVIFAGGDDFLLLGPLTEAISLTTNLHRLWTGEASPLTQPLEPAVDGWVQYNSQIYPVPGKKMNFSLGVVIAQRRVPQSLWHRGLNQAYKEAKNQGRNRICIKVLFNSGQSLEWVCPWPLWNMLMFVEPTTVDKTELNRWEKLLSYLESSRLQNVSIFTVGELIETLWASVGIPLKWDDVIVWRRDFNTEIENWQWWINWISLRAFLARQDRERQKWLQLVTGGKR
jgi:CRISPR-associated protein Cmr2